MPSSLARGRTVFTRSRFFQSLRLAWMHGIIFLQVQVHTSSRDILLDLVVCFSAKDVCVLDKCSEAERLSESQVFK